MNHSINSNTTYWVLQLIGWSIYGAFGVFIIASFNPITFNTVATPFVGAYILLLSTHLFRNMIKRKNWKSLPIKNLLLKVFFVILFISLVSQLLMTVILVFVFKQFALEETSVSVYFMYVINTKIILWLWTVIYFGIYYFKKYKNEEIEKWKLQSTIKEAELTILKSQINPHFLFNGLNNIRALVNEDPEKARKMITGLSDFLRYSIHYSDNEVATIAEEIEIVNDYLEIQSIQFEERLNYSFQISDEAKKVRIPPMTIQLLVENAIKHGISMLPKGGEIIIKVFVDDNTLIIEVRNSGSYKPSNSGIGLKNISDRLRIMSGNNSHFTIENSGSNSVISKITIPIKDDKTYNS